MRSFQVEDIDSELMSQLSFNATNGRKALERHPDSPFQQDWARNQVLYEEKSPEPGYDGQERTYEDFVGIEGLDEASNPHAVVKHLLEKPVDDRFEENVNTFLWDHLENTRSIDHPGRENGYSHPDDVLVETSELATFVEYALGYTVEGDSGIDSCAIQDMAYRAQSLEDYFDRSTALL